MKKVFVVFLFIFSTVSTFAQSEGESVKPIGGITLYRNVSLAAIEQNNYLDVIVKFKAAELGDYFTNGVKVVVVDNNTGKKIYRKRFSKSYQNLPDSCPYPPPRQHTAPLYAEALYPYTSDRNVYLSQKARARHNDSYRGKKV